MITLQDNFQQGMVTIHINGARKMLLMWWCYRGGYPKLGKSGEIDIPHLMFYHSGKSNYPSIVLGNEDEVLIFSTLPQFFPRTF